MGVGPRPLHYPLSRIMTKRETAATNRLLSVTLRCPPKAGLEGSKHRLPPEMTLRRGFTLSPGEKILVVEDVITTGGSTRECIAALEAAGGKVVAAASIIDRSNGAADVGVSRIALASLDVPTYTEDQCPMCFGGDRPVKPGSRSI